MLLVPIPGYVAQVKHKVPDAMPVCMRFPVQLDQPEAATRDPE
jgi:hypothetical protein